MKVCLVQTRPEKGNIAKNIADHLRWIDVSVQSGAYMAVFPELSLTGYEPSLAHMLAMQVDDSRLEIFQTVSAKNNIILAVGAPLLLEEGTGIGMIIFERGKPRQVYFKHFLHDDELPYFVPGPMFSGTVGTGVIRMAICYEVSVPDHQAATLANGGEVYLASVAKSVDGVPQALHTLSTIASQYGVVTMMANSTGHADDFKCGGMSSAWDRQGNLVGQLDATHEGILVVDIGGNTTTTKVLSRTSVQS
jgi:predicted amidohydrolase